MNQQLRELKISFYYKKWDIDESKKIASRGGISLWIGNGAYHFTGYNCCFDIPIKHRKYLYRHFKIGVKKFDKKRKQ